MSDFAKQQVENESKLSQATQLMNLLEAFPVFYDQDNQVYICITINAHTEVWDINSKNFEQWMSHQYYLTYRRTISRASLSEVAIGLSGRARFDSKYRQTFLRAAYSETGYWLDLGDPSWAGIHIEPGQWTGKPSCDPMFIRRESTMPLPLPLHNGVIDPLWGCINIPEKDRLLVITYLIECLRPETHHPILVLDGEQGSAKSTTQRMLKELIDPSAMPLRVAPKKDQDLFIAAANDHLLSYNNLSSISPEQQDALCCLSTGGTFATRQLYTNNAEVVVSILRPVILNGIGTLITAQDLLERSLYLELPILTEYARQTDSELNQRFEENRAGILGGLLNIMCKALALLPEMSKANLPRMADFVLLGRAVASVLGLDPSEFDQLYKDNQRRALEKGLDTCPIYPALVRMLDDMPHGFYGNYSELLQKLERFSDVRPQDWPKSAKGVSKIIKRQAAALRKININVVFDSVRYSEGYRVGIDKQLGF